MVAAFAARSLEPVRPAEFSRFFDAPEAWARTDETLAIRSVAYYLKFEES